MIANLKKRFVTTRGSAVLQQIINRKGLFLLATLIDLIYLGIIVAIGTFVSSKIPTDQNALLQYFGNTTNLMVFAILYPLLYYLLIILIYSAVKLILLHYYESMHQSRKISFSKFWQFYGLNILLYFSFFAVFLLLISVFGLLLQKEFLKYVLVVITPFFVFFLMAIVHIAHAAFIHGSTQRNFKKSFSLTFKKVKRYGAFLLWDIAFIGVFYIVFNAIHILLRYTVFTNQALVARLSQPYTSLISIVSLVFIFLILGFNRLYFLEADRKNVYS